MAYEIPIATPDFSGGIANILTALSRRRLERNAEQELEIKRGQLANDERRLNAEAYRRQKEFEQGQEDRRNKALLSSLEFEKRGDRSTAAMIRRQHGIETTPEMSEPLLYTPAMALAAAKPEMPTGEPVKLESSPVQSPVVTPFNALSRRGEHAGITVPDDEQTPLTPGFVATQPPPFRPDEETQTAPTIPPPGVTIEEPQTGRAVQDLLPYTEEAAPTGALRFTGPEGKFIGRFDPEEERKFRAERAGRVSQALGPMGEAYTRVADLIARGDISEAEGKVLLSTLASEAVARERMSAKEAEREDRQAFQAEQNAQYRRTFEQQMQLANALGGSRIAAAAMSLPFKQETANQQMQTALEHRTKLVQSTAQYQKLATADKTIRSLEANLAKGTEGLQHKDAQVLLARLMRQAQPTEGEMRLLYHDLGGWTDKFDQFKAKVMSGDLSPEQMRQLVAASKTIAHEHEEDKRRFIEVARKGLGPGTGFDLAPTHAQQVFEMMGAELGLENLPQLYGTEGGFELGSKQAPTVRPKPQSARKVKTLRMPDGTTQRFDAETGRRVE